MKKLHRHQWLYLIRQSEGGGRRASILRDRRRRKAVDGVAAYKRFELSAANAPVIPVHPSTWVRSDGSEMECVRLPAPADFHYARNSEGVLAFVYALRREAVLKRRLKPRPGGGPPLYIDLDPIEHIDLEGALILAAELDRVRLTMRIKPTLDDANWRPHIRSLLYSFGLHKLVEAKRAQPSVHIHNINEGLKEIGIQIVPFISGTAADGSCALRMQNSLIEANPAAGVRRKDFYAAMIEAITNVVQHAYDRECEDDGLPSVRQWWAGGLVDTENGSLYIAVYDQGVGIPATLPRKSYFRSILGLERLERTDQSVIAAALEYGRSRTEAEGRGNGLWSMCQILHDLDAADVRITSGLGQVTYEKGSPMQLEPLAIRFPGTLIRWRVALPKERLVDDHH